MFVTIDNLCSALTSSDGVIWNERSVKVVSAGCSGMGYVKQTFLITGLHGIIAQSDPVSESGGGHSASGSSGGSDHCFVATAAYGSFLDPHVTVLRKFRDNLLMTNRWGRSLVNFYYYYSPPAADYIRHHELVRLFVRSSLTPIVLAIEYPFLFLLLTLLIMLVIFRFKRIKKIKNDLIHQILQ